MNSHAMKCAVLAGGIVVLSLLLTSGPALADTLPGTTTVTFSSNPATLVVGDDVTITTTTTAPSHSPSPPTTATLIDAGKVTIELATDGSGNPVPAASVVTWVALNAPGQNPVGGITNLSLDLDNLSALGLGLNNFTPGTTGGFRAHYVTGGGQHKVDTHFSPAVDLTATSSCSPGVNVGATLASGDGTPNPGDSGPWTFAISVENCTGVNLTGVKVQGGTSGWTNYVGFSVPDGNVTLKKMPKKTQVLTWIVDIDNGQTKTIEVTVNGKVPCSAPDGQILFISGPWSAVFDDGSGPQKSAYSGRVSLTVDGSTINPSCP
jgi:hypothetical protein